MFYLPLARLLLRASTSEFLEEDIGLFGDTNAPLHPWPAT